MAKNTFIVSDETINCYGCIIRTDGISTARFERNPIMYYMHDREKGVIGRWENVRKEGTKLMADAVFDEGTELGAHVKHQVETGFLRTASIGIENCKCKTINGVEIIKECDLIEISIVDVPANENAVKLFKKGWKPVKTLSELKKDETENDNDGDSLRTRIIDVLGLSETVTDKDIIEHIKTLLKEPQNAEKEVEEAIKCGLISTADKNSFRAMAQANIKAFRAYCKGRKDSRNKEIETLLNRNVNKILPYDRHIFALVGERLGTDVLKTIIDSMPTPIRLTQLLAADSRDRSTWTLDDYRKFDPEALRDDPALYKRLVAQASGNVQGHKDLDYYRRYDPEYLAQNPDFYRQLLDNKQF